MSLRGMLRSAEPASAHVYNYGVDVLSQEAREFIGDRLVAYMLGVPSEELDRLLVAARSTDQVKILDQLEALGQRFIAESHGLPDSARRLPLSFLTFPRDANESPVANQIREMFVGRLEIETADVPFGYLAKIGLDAMPAAIVGEMEPRGMHAPVPTASIYNHPSAADFEQAVLEDEALSALFPIRGDRNETSGMLFYASGSGGGLQLSMLAELLFSGARRTMSGDDPQELVDRLHEQLVSARRIGTDGIADAIALVGISGLELPDGNLVRLPWGVLRHSKPDDFVLSLAGPPPEVSATCTLEVPRTLDVTIGESLEGSPSVFPGSFEDWRREMQLVKTKTALAILLAVKREPPVRIVAVAERTLLPLSSGDSMSHRPDIGFRPAVGIGPGDDKAIERWAKLLDERYDPAIEIACTRTLRALAERGDPIDGLIDVVIGWESLFSAGQGELGFRISASIAWLLAPADTPRRRALFKEVKKLYDDRSRVLHGRPMTLDDAHPKYQRAVGISVEILRALFESRTDLIPEQGRAELLLLGRDE